MALKYVAAFNLAVVAGAQPDAALITKIVTAGGLEADAAEIKDFLAAVEGKNVEETIAAGRATLDTVKIGAAPAAGAAAGAAPAAAAAAVVEEEEEEAMEFDLF